MEGVLVRQATREDALLVAALTLQAARAQGLPGEPGFLDRYAEAWLAARDFHPAWWAELDGEHAGLLVTIWFRPLPWPGRARGGGVLRTDRLFVRADQPRVPIETALRAAAREWATARGVDEVLVD
ncbi:MAG TPA: GNAT family N-acetyltransferase [Propionibacterium sp.]|jgi:GNAT superfamily N-acetyltransferase|nr:GNAT family N-acetyltransferase [Propionibacterium sp.]